MGSFCSFTLTGSVTSTRIIHILDSMESVCSLQEKCTMNIKYTERHLSFDVSLDESQEKVCSLILDKRDEVPINFTMIFSCHNKILLREGMDLRKLLNQIPDNVDAANNFSTMNIDFLVGYTDKEASVSCNDNVLSVTLNVKKYPVLEVDKDPVGIFPTRVLIPSEVLHLVLWRFTGELEQDLESYGKNGRVLLSISGTEFRQQLDAGDGIQGQGQLSIQATYNLYRVWYLTSMLRREHGGVLGNIDAVFMWKAWEHKLSFQVRSQNGGALATLIIY